MSDPVVPAESNSASATLPTRAEDDGWVFESKSGSVPQTAESIGQAIADAAAVPETAAPLPDTDGNEPEAVDAKAAQPDAAKKRTRADRRDELQKQINALTRDKHARFSEIRAAEEKLAALNRQLAQGTAPAPAAAPAPPQTATPAQAAKVEAALPPKPRWADFENEGKTWDEYQDARDVWDEQRLVALRTEVEEGSRKKAEETAALERDRAGRASYEQQHQDKVARARATHEDFDEVITANLSDLPKTPFLEDVVRRHPNGAEFIYRLAQTPEIAAALADLTTQATYPMMDAVLSMDDPMLLLGYFAQHPQEFARFARADLDPRAALMGLGRLIERVEGVRPTAPPPSRRSQAPPPVRPVAGTRTNGNPASLDDLDFGPEYIRAANAADRARGVRL